MGTVYEITSEQDFRQLMESQAQLVVLDIYATWCSPCKILAPKLEELARNYPNVLFSKINVETNVRTASSLPTIEFWALEDGQRKLKHSVVGANLQEIIQTLQGFTNPSFTSSTIAPKKVQSQYKSFSDL